MNRHLLCSRRSAACLAFVVMQARRPGRSGGRSQRPSDHLRRSSKRPTRPNIPQVPEDSNDDLVQSQKLELLGSLITTEIMLQRAEKLGLQAVDADVETEVNKMKAPTPKRSSTSSSPTAT